MNKVILVGRLGADPEMKYTQSGVACCNLRVATEEKYKGEKKVEWHRVTTWGKLAEIGEQYLKKGMQVLLEGKLNTRSYEKDGQKVWVTSVLANNMQMLGGKKDNEGVEPKQESRQQAAPPVNSDLQSYVTQKADDDLTYGEIPF
jgi:single-strand DNA-binding protein